jgi:hypothetical protein
MSRIKPSMGTERLMLDAVADAYDAQIKTTAFMFPVTALPGSGYRVVGA